MPYFERVSKHSTLENILLINLTVLSIQLTTQTVNLGSHPIRLKSFNNYPVLDELNKMESIKSSQRLIFVRLGNASLLIRHFSLGLFKTRETAGEVFI